MPCSQGIGQLLGEVRLDRELRRTSRQLRKRAELTLVSEAWSVAIREEALAWVEIVLVDLMVTIEPDSANFWADVVMRRVPSDEARAVT